MTIQEAAAVEPVVTADVRHAAAGGRLHGLEFRLKSPAALAVKIGRKAEAELAATPAEVAGDITDLLRYTVVADTPKEVIPMVRSTVKRLNGSGWGVVAAEHSWVLGNPYKGIHAVLRSFPSTVLRSPRGQAVEIQFHSEESARVTDACHPLYEVMRDGNRPAGERGEAFEEMVRAWREVQAPVGLDGLRTLGGVPVVLKTYSNPFDRDRKGHTS